MPEIVLIPYAGESVYYVSKLAFSIAYLTRQKVEFDFNGHEIFADPKDLDITVVTSRYMKMIDQRTVTP